ncbi:MAG TPA: hypothetical protein PLF13_10510 [candidate division Zixibacteria bacterium]|nr:hypothetical protein [candidate division Zixibacteria bacterium]
MLFIGVGLLLWPVRSEAKSHPARGPVRVLIQNDVRIHQPGCDDAAEFSLSEAVAEHIRYILTVKQIQYDMALVDFSNPATIPEQDSTSTGTERKLVVIPEKITRSLSTGCDRELEIRLHYALTDGRIPPGSIEPTDLAVGIVRYEVACTTDTTAGHEVHRGKRIDPIKSALREAVKKLAESLPVGNSTLAPTGIPWPTVVYVDSSYLRAFSGRWLETVNVTFEITSRALSEQFGRRLEMSPPRIMTEGLDSTRSFEELFDRLRQRLPDHGDTLTVVLYNQPIGSDGELPAYGRMELGRAQVGRRLVLLEGLPDPSDPDLYWLPFDNGISLIHEIGHVLGAVHVSDIYSVMHPNATWTGTDRFDDFNRRIITAALDGKLTFRSSVEYIEFFVRTLETSDYYRVDYPEVLAGYLQNAASHVRGRLLRAAIGNASFLHAAEGYLLLSMGQADLARTSFEQAVRVDSNQASLYYYLSLVSDTQTAQRLRERAAEMGYYAAMQCRTPMLPTSD